jgi:hypothetical protein
VSWCPAQVLHAAIKQLAGFDFTMTDSLDGTLFTLDLLTRAPLLQHALVSVLAVKVQQASCAPAVENNGNPCNAVGTDKWHIAGCGGMA